MSVTSQIPRKVSTAAAGATLFPYDFKVLSKFDMQVQVDGVEKTVDVDYTLSGVGLDAGGDITFLNPMVGGETVMRRRLMAFERSNDFQQLGDLRSPTLNNDQDAPIMMIQQVADDVGRSIKLPVSNTGSGDVSNFVPLAPLVVSADGNGIEGGDTNLTGDMLLRPNLANADAGASLVAFKQGADGAVSRTLQDKLREALPVSVLDYIPVAQHAAIKDRTSTYDCTADFQKALADLQARTDGGRMFIPNGSYQITGQLNYTGKSIVIEGESEEGVRLVSSAPAHTFNLQLTGPIGATPAQQTYDASVIRNMAIFPAANSTGAAINIEYTQDNGVFCFTLIENVRLQNDLTNPWSFKWGIRTANAGGVTLRRITVYFLGPASEACYFIENSLTTGAFGVKLENCDFNGAQYGIKQRGWMESLYIGPGSAIVGSTDCIDLDATGTTFGSPHLVVTGVHFNAKRHVIRTVNWRTIFVYGSDIFAGVGTDDVNGDGVQVTSGQWVHINGCKFEQGVLSTTRGGVSLNDVQGYAISGNTFNNITGTVISAFGSSSDRGTISGNVMWRDTGTAGVTGIFMAGPNYCAITGNLIRNYGKAIEVSGQAATITGNIIRTASQGIIGSGAQTIAYNNLFASVTTPFTTVGQREFFATVSVDPPSVPAGGGATSVVAVPGAAVGDFVDVAAPYDMTDVMVTAQVIASGSVGLYYWNRTGSPVDKAAGNWKFRIHS